MKALVVASNGSGGGKTTVTLGLLKLLKNRGLEVQSYKVGPDYLDTAFQSKVTGKASRNLDIHLMGEKGVKAAFSRGKGEMAVIEGVMGLYDGKGITTEGSTAHIAKLLKLPVVLVLSPKAQVATLCAEIEGMRNFEAVNIVGVILNNTSESYYRLLKLAIESRCAIKVFGYLPKSPEIVLPSRHLGLVQSSEIENLDQKIQLCSELLEKHVDIEELLQCFKEAEEYEDSYHIRNLNIKTAVAYDKAFSFYYEENLELLKEAGEVQFFSPLKDKELPKGIDFLYLGGGYPEVFNKELSRNKSMLKSIKEALNCGLSCYAECGGLMYLTEEIDGEKMVGFLEGKAFMTKGLQNFGYAQIEVINENPILPKGLTINCHEFHKSKVDLKEAPVYKVSKKTFDESYKFWNCGYVKNNTVAAYGHVHFFGNPHMLESLIKNTYKG